MYLLDTDHLIILQREQDPEFSSLRGAMNRHAPHDFFLSLVSFHEQILGAHTYLTRLLPRPAVRRARCGPLRFTAKFGAHWNDGFANRRYRPFEQADRVDQKHSRLLQSTGTDCGRLDAWLDAAAATKLAQGSSCGLAYDAPRTKPSSPGRTRKYSCRVELA